MEMKSINYVNRERVLVFKKQKTCSCNFLKNVSTQGEPAECSSVWLCRHTGDTGTVAPCHTRTVGGETMIVDSCTGDHIDTWIL